MDTITLILATVLVTMTKQKIDNASTDSEKKMIISVAKEIGIDNVEAYKISAIEKISGYKFD